MGVDIVGINQGSCYYTDSWQNYMKKDECQVGSLLFKYKKNNLRKGMTMQIEDPNVQIEAGSGVQYIF